MVVHLTEVHEIYGTYLYDDGRVRRWAPGVGDFHLRKRFRSEIDIEVVGSTVSTEFPVHIIQVALRLIMQGSLLGFSNWL